MKTTEVLNIVRQMVADGQISQEVAERYFPELAESKDERIRKAIIEHFTGLHSSVYPYKGFTKEQILAWLEKKGEQKPAAWSEEDEENSKNILYILNQFKGFAIYSEDKTAENCIDWLKSIKSRTQPQSQWKPSEEMLEALYRAIPIDVMEKSEDEILLDKLYQGLKYGKVLSNK